MHSPTGRAAGARMLAVWSMQPYGREFNNRAVTLEIGGWERFAGLPAAVDLITGDSFGIPFEVKDGGSGSKTCR